jgi:hypothetical protein
MSHDVALEKPAVTGEAAAEVAATPKDAHTLSAYPPFQRTLEVLSIGAFIGLSLYLFASLMVGAQGADFWLIGASAFGGYLLADFGSGLVHWLFDTWGSIDTPFVGKNFIRPFREHHFDQKAITRHDFIETNGNNCLVSLPLLIAAACLTVEHGHWMSIVTCSLLLFVCLGTFATNQFHQWAHTDEAPAFVRALQRMHLILPKDHHDIHHMAPYDTHYCITTGWMNGGLRAIRFYRILERTITATTGAKPRRDDLS